MDNLSLWIGSIGVSILLIAFILNVIRKLSENGTVYLLLNCIGASLAAFYAFKTGSVPFLILELAWVMAALVRLILRHTKAPTK